MATSKVAKSAKEKKKDGASKAKAAAGKNSALSNERVVDSDSDDEAAAVSRRTKQPANKAPKKTPKTITTAPPPPPPKQPESPASDSSSEEEESPNEGVSDDEMPDASASRKPEIVPAKVNGVKRKADEQSSSSSSEDEDSGSDEESSKEAEAGAEKQPDAKRVKTLSAEEESSSEQGPSSEDEEESDEDIADAPTANAFKATVAAKPTSIPAQPFKPPPGYTPLSITSSAIDFSGKQIWHITAPASISLKDITELPLDIVDSGATVLKHKGTDYALNEDTGHTTQFHSVSVPHNDGYQSAPLAIIKTLHLQQKIDLPNLTKKQANLASGSTAAANIAQPAITSARPQPKGMRMRYKPPGFGSGDPGIGSDSESEEARQSFKSSTTQFPKALGGHAPSVEETPKSKKSKKNHKDPDVAMINDSDAKTISQEQPTPKAELSKSERKRMKEEKKKARKMMKAEA